MTPIKGPFNRTKNKYGGPTYYNSDPLHLRSESKTWYTQAKPYDRPLNFRAQCYEVLRFDHVSPPGWENVHRYEQSRAFFVMPAGMQDNAYNKAYAKLVESLRGEKAGLGLTLVQHQQAWDMITERFHKLIRFTRELKRFKFNKAARILGVAKPKKLRRGSKYFSQNYLEFHFGWSPLIGDIYSAIGVLASNPPTRPLKARASVTERTFQSNPNGAFRHCTYVQKCQIGADYKITNLNLFLSESMGLVNPALVAWDAVPWSFVLDWFVNVSQILSSYTDFLGVELINPYRTFKSEFTVKELIDFTLGKVRSYGEARGSNLERIVGPLPRPVLRLRPPWRVSYRRGLAAISLLIGLLPRK